MRVLVRSVVVEAVQDEGIIERLELLEPVRSSPGTRLHDEPHERILGAHCGHRLGQQLVEPHAGSQTTIVGLVQQVVRDQREVAAKAPGDRAPERHQRATRVAAFLGPEAVLVESGDPVGGEDHDDAVLATRGQDPIQSFERVPVGLECWPERRPVSGQALSGLLRGGRFVCPGLVSGGTVAAQVEPQRIDSPRRPTGNVFGRDTLERGADASQALGERSPLGERGRTRRARCILQRSFARAAHSNRKADEAETHQSHALDTPGSAASQPISRSK